METAVTQDELRQQLTKQLTRAKGRPSELIQVLHWVQENYGYIPAETHASIADALGVTLSEVYGVITFYSFFSLKPKGRYHITCCKGTACYVRGAPDIIARLQTELGIGPGDTTDDGMFSLEVVRCLGACGLSPVIMVNQTTHARVKPENIPALLERYLQSDGASRG